MGNRRLRSPVFYLPYMSIIKTRKLIVKRTYLLVEKEEIEFACSQSEKEIKEYMLKYIEDEYEEINKKKEEEILQKQKSCNPDSDEENSQPKTEEESDEKEADDPPEENLKEHTIKNDKDPVIKKLYRQIAQKTHPDKTTSQEEAILFNVAATCYRTGDIGGLLHIAESLNLEIPNLSDALIKKLENKVNQLESEINSNKETVGWLWYSCDTEEEKIELLKKMLINQGYKL